MRILLGTTEADNFAIASLENDMSTSGNENDLFDSLRTVCICVFLTIYLFFTEHYLFALK